jgi:antitoxin (DNA-binding transcriptional repressor) of toxin-antitoxin stability system
MTAITISQARAVLPELLRRVEEGEEITITRHGQAVAVLVRPDVLRPRMEVVIEDRSGSTSWSQRLRVPSCPAGPG